MRRDDAEEKWNCEVGTNEVPLAQAVQIPWNGAVARSFSVAVLVLRNTRTIAKGDGVLLKWPKPKEAARPPRTGTTWWTNANAEVKRRKRVAGAAE